MKYLRPGFGGGSGGASGGGGWPGPLLAKTDAFSPAFVTTGSNQGISIKAGSSVLVGGSRITFGEATPVAVPTHAIGDYAIWALPDGSIVSTSNFSAPPADGAIRVGGYHYAPGGPAPIPSTYAGSTGGNSTPQIFLPSIWDINFRPACPDPRGMAYFGTGFGDGWVDLYPCAQNHIIGGTSQFGVAVASGARPPRIPLDWGGTGSNNYPDGRWYFFSQVMLAHGKRLPTQDEYMRFAYGSTPGRAVGADPVNATLDAQTTSRFCFRASGSWWCWGDSASFGGTSESNSWVSRSNGLGNDFAGTRAVRLGGSWITSGDAGPAASLRLDLPSGSVASLGGRGVAGHLMLA